MVNDTSRGAPSIQETTFNLLRPICTALYTNSDLTREKSLLVSQLLKELSNELDQVPDPETTLTPPLIDYILRPLFSVFQSLKSANTPYSYVLEPWLSCLLFMLTRTQWKASHSEELLRQLLTLFAFCIDAIAFGKEAKQTSEETKHLAIQCISAVLPMPGGDNVGPTNEFSNRLLDALRAPSFRPGLGHCVNAILNVILNEYSIQLRIDALQTLSQLLLNNIQHVDILAAFLPGTTTYLCRTLEQKKEKENHRIISATLDVLGDLIRAVMRDHENSMFFSDVRTLKDLQLAVTRRTQTDVQPHMDTQEENKGSVADIKSGPLTVTRSASWHMTTKKMIFDRLKRVLSISSHPEWRARLASCRLAAKLLQSCYRSLDNCKALLLETLVLHTDDEYDAVSNFCAESVDGLAVDPESRVVLNDTLRTNLYEKLLSLPQHIISGDDQEKMNAIKLVSGYVLHLKEGSHSVLDMALRRASDGWLAAFAIDRNSLNVLDERPATKAILSEETPDQTLLYPRMRHTHLVTDRTALQAGRMLNVIGRYGNLEACLQHFLKYASLDDSNAPEALFVIHCLLSGSTLREDTVMDTYLAHLDEEDDMTQTKALAQQVLHVVMDRFIDTKVRQEQNTRSPVRWTRAEEAAQEDRTTVLSICFGLQVVGLTASILQAETMQDELISILYPLLARLGAPNIYIHTYALITLDTIALVFGQPGAKELAIANIDYVINMISRRICLPSDQAGTPLVLKALIRVGGTHVIYYLGDTIEEIYDALDRYHSNTGFCAQLCGVLTEIIQSLHHSTMLQIASDQASNDATMDDAQQKDNVSPEIKDFLNGLRCEAERMSEETPTMEAIGRYFLERQKKKEHDEVDLESILKDGLGEEDDNRHEEIQKATEDKTPPLSRDQQLVVGIMSKARNFLSAGSPQLRAQMLEMLAQGVPLLAGRHELNQVIHTMWSLIVKRLDDKHDFVIFYAAALIQSVAETSKDFLTVRVSKDVWTRFRELLKQGSLEKSSAAYYSPFSHTQRLMQCILKTMTVVAVHVLLSTEIVLDILECTKPFLDQRMPPEIQAHAMDLYSALGDRYPDRVWLTVFTLLGDEAKIVSNGPHLKPFVLPDWMKPKTPYAKANAKRLYTHASSSLCIQ